MCHIGTYSTGGNLTICLNSNCVDGEFANKLGAVSATDGCVDKCPTGTVKSKNIFGDQVCQACPSSLIKDNECVYSLDPSWKIYNSSLPFKR